MRRSFVFSAIALVLLVAVSSLSIVAQRAAPPPRRPGLVEPGITQLPNGWRIAPAGRHAQIGDLPLNMVWSPDGRYLLITNNGWAKPSITVFDTTNFFIQCDAAARSRLAGAGLASGRQAALLVGRGAEHRQRAGLERRRAQGRRADRDRQAGAAADLRDAQGFGVRRRRRGARRTAAISTRCRCSVSAVSMIDLGAAQGRADRAPERRAGTRPSCRRTASRCSSRSGAARRCWCSTPRRWSCKARSGSASIPTRWCSRSDGTRLFVACANTNAVWVGGPRDAAARPNRSAVALFPNAPPGTTPNALALSPDGKTLLVANADNNTVAVVDVAAAGASRVRGFIPTGWYPTGVTFSNATAGGSSSSTARACRRRPTRAARSPACSAPDGQYIAHAAPGRAVRDLPCPTTSSWRR